MKAFRAAAFLTQKDLAGLLDVSQSLVASVETGVRQLPAAATFKLLDLEAAWLQQSKEKKQELPPEVNAVLARYRQEAVASLTNQINKEVYTVKKLELELQRMADSFKEVQQKLLLINAWKQMPQDKGATLYLACMEVDAMKHLKRCSPPLQALLRVRLQVAETALATSRKALAALKTRTRLISIRTVKTGTKQATDR